MALTAKTIENAKPQSKIYRLTDSGGLYLEITPAGNKHWRQRYYFNKEEKLVTHGSWPQMSLVEAREKRAEIKDQLRAGIDPAIEKRREKAALEAARDNTFESIATVWMVNKAADWTDDTAVDIKSRLERYVFPHIGKIPISELEVPDIHGMIQRIERKGLIPTARRAWRDCRSICSYAVITQQAKYNAAAGLEDALASHKVTHHPAPIEEDDVAAVMRKIYSGYSRPVTDCAVRLLPLFFVRSNELVSAEWTQMSLEEGTWKFKSKKVDVDLIVPLATQAIEILRELYKITGRTKYVFASQNKPGVHLNSCTLNDALKRLGLTADVVTPHGFRATARTVIAEKLKYPADQIEQQLSHTVKDPLGRAYNRTTFLDERREMMQAWADHIDEMKGGG